SVFHSFGNRFASFAKTNCQNLPKKLAFLSLFLHGVNPKYAFIAGIGLQAQSQCRALFGCPTKFNGKAIQKWIISYLM
ncbi:MAG: hypothetical protein EB055_04095, partial [Micrococcales bacterium]|nr:hypothetical protein [Micrococcales bacterium]